MKALRMVVLIFVLLALVASMAAAYRGGPRVSINFGFGPRFGPVWQQPCYPPPPPCYQPYGQPWQSGWQPMQPCPPPVCYPQQPYYNGGYGYNNYGGNGYGGNLQPQIDQLGALQNALQAQQNAQNAWQRYNNGPRY